MEEETQTTLRDTIANALDTVETQQEETKTEAAPVETKTETDRSRDDQGRYAQKAEIKPALETEKAKAALVRPSSWKKDYWGHFDKLSTGQPLTPQEARSLAEYNVQRESEFAKGISTYKTEWDTAKPILDEINPIIPMIEQRGLTPQTWLRAVKSTFQTLNQGSPEQKLSMLFSLARDYQVPLEQIFEQGEDGRFYLNPQKFQQVNQPQQNNQAPPQQQDMRQVMREILMEENATKQVSDFTQNSTEFPHVEQVRETMAGLLRAGLVEDLKTAYHTALNMPKHADLRESTERQQRDSDAEKQRADAVKAAQVARSKTVSPRSSTPANPVKTEKGNGIRSAVEDAFNEHSGRV